MTGKTAATTYAVIEAPVPASRGFIWAATIHRHGFKRTETLLAYSETMLKARCGGRGVTRFENLQVSE